MDTIIFIDRNLEINLYKCLYVFENKSSIGKSYLREGTKDIAGRPKIVTFDTKSDYDDLIETGFTGSGNSIYILNRFDFFKSDELSNIIKDVNNLCILIDTKDWLNVRLIRDDYRVAKIERPTFERFILKDAYI